MAKLSLREDFVPAPQIQMKDDFSEEFNSDEEVSYSGHELHFTKDGKPDRRFKGQRDIPDIQIYNPHYRRPSVGGVDEDKGIHVTSHGAPDRRYKENRAMTPEEAEIAKAEAILVKYGKIQKQS